MEIDNNGIENAIRPTAVGKKNWLFVGGEETGERSAVIYTLIESAKRHGRSGPAKRSQRACCDVVGSGGVSQPKT